MSKKYKRIVVKLGTSVLTGGSHQRLDRAHMVELVRQCATLHHSGYDVIVCTSGAVAVGRAQLGFPDLPPTITSKQVLASVGQTRLMLTWERLFELYDIHVGQVLLTRTVVENRQRYLNARDSLTAMLEHNIIPVINENDAIATEEIRVGDNDNLSALVAMLVNADLLLLLTDQPGLFTADPRSNPEAKLIPEVYKIDESLKALATGSKSGLGIGGMVTKLQAANIARHAGTDVIIAAGSAPEIITRATTGKSVGTRFPALTTRLENRKQWILAGAKPSGILKVDNGAVRALRHKGRSLLPAGIVKVSGDFLRGDTVSIVDMNEHELARGLASYASEELKKLQGCQSDEIYQRLGYAYRSVAIHRNDMALLVE